MEKMLKSGFKCYIAVHIFWLSQETHLLWSLWDDGMQNLSEPFNAKGAATGAGYFSWHIHWKMMLYSNTFLMTTIHPR